jgi:hypothetical protein
VPTKLIASFLGFLLLVPLTRVEASSSASPPLAPDAVFSAEQLDNLLAPIALYPDPLIAQVLPASTFVDQVDTAARWLRTGKSPNKIDQEDWDISVKAVGHYPQVIYMMADDLDWTTAVGQAYVSQSTDVMSSIQRLRARAKSSGALVSSPEQTVLVEQQTIKIVPAQPQVIYVPQYNPQVVYVEHEDDNDWEGAAVAGAIAFGTGVAIGAWLNNDCDWNNGNVYYHGWNGSGWVSHSSSYVNVHNSAYVNRSFTNVNVNKTVVNRNVNYNNISNYNNVNRNVNYNNVQANRVNATRQTNISNANVNTSNRKVNNSVIDRNANPSDQRLDSYRGREAQPATQKPRQQAATPTAPRTRTAQPSSQPSAFGGNKPRAETQADSARGRASRSEASQWGGGGDGSRQARTPTRQSADAASQRSGGSRPQARPSGQRSGGGGGRRRN